VQDGVDQIIEQWRRERPDLDPEPIGVIGRISRLAREIEQEGPPYQLRPGEFGSSLMLTSSGTTKRLDRLERGGLITRTPDPGDRRGVLITLTPAGLELIDNVTDAHLANEHRLLAGLSESDRRRLAALLRKLQLTLPRSGG
jgi:DNA-binding MarR family transcriptional regulator